MNIVRGNEELFRTYEKEIMDIYIDSGSTGYMEQHLDRKTETDYCYDLFQSGGYGYFTFVDNHPISLMLITPLHYNELLPQEIQQSYPIEKCIYIDEMEVHRDFRGQGVGTQMMHKCMKEIDRSKYDWLFIRSWKNNVPAIRFYEKMGFTLSDFIIDQNKIKKDGVTPFVIQKQYLVQKL